MKPTETFLGQPIRSLQTMLRVLAENDDAYKALIPDGIYGPDTMEAVRIFQRRNRLPITGITDQLTWEAVVEAYQLALVEVVLPEPLQVLLNPGQVIRFGEKNPAVSLAQVVLTVLSENYRCLHAPAVTGILDSPTKDALEVFQQLSGLPITGNLDRRTWKNLTLQFPMASNQPVNEGTREVYNEPED